jgi:SSS family solute:Na+ symporter
MLLGVWIGRRVDTSGAFFVAGRRLGPGLIFATVLAANIGAGSTVGAAGLGYRDGLSAWWWVGSAGIGTLLLALWVGPRIWRIAKQREFLTVGDFLEARYGRSVRAVIAILLWLGTLAILAGQLIAVAWVLDVVAGIPKVAGCLIGGGVMIVYFAAGGLLTSAWVNLVQLVGGPTWRCLYRRSSSPLDCCRRCSARATSGQFVLVWGWPVWCCSCSPSFLRC